MKRVAQIVAGQLVGVAIADEGDATVTRVDPAVLDILPEPVCDAGIGHHDGVDAGTVGNFVVSVDIIGVVTVATLKIVSADSTDQDIIAVVAEENVVALPAIEGISDVIASERVALIVSGQADALDAPVDFPVLDAFGKNVTASLGDDDPVIRAARILFDGIAGVDIVRIAAVAADQRVGTQSAVERVGELIAGQLVGAVVTDEVDARNPLLNLAVLDIVGQRIRAAFNDDDQILVTGAIFLENGVAAVDVVGIVAIAAVEAVCTVSSAEKVVGFSAIDGVVAAAAVDRIAAAAVADDSVGEVIAGQRIITTCQFVKNENFDFLVVFERIGRIRKNRIDAAVFALGNLVFGRNIVKVVARSALQGINTRISIESVVSTSADDGIVAFAATKKVIVRAAIEGVAAVAAFERISLVIARDFVGKIVAEYAVLPRDRPRLWHDPRLWPWYGLCWKRL